MGCWAADLAAAGVGGGEDAERAQARGLGSPIQPHPARTHYLLRRPHTQDVELARWQLPAHLRGPPGLRPSSLLPLSWPAGIAEKISKHASNTAMLF